MPGGIYCSTTMLLQACQEHGDIFVHDACIWNTTHFGAQSVIAPTPLSVS